MDGPSASALALGWARWGIGTWLDVHATPLIMGMESRAAESPSSAWRQMISRSPLASEAPRNMAPVCARARACTGRRCASHATAVARGELTFSNITTEPHPPAVQLVRTRSVEDDALGEAVVVLKKQHHALVKVLLP